VRCTRDFDPKRYKDEYRKAVLDVIEQKAAGKEIARAGGGRARGLLGSDGGARGEPGRRRR
jgi:non-homologous end joining protein Ku